MNVKEYVLVPSNIYDSVVLNRSSDNKSVCPNSDSVDNVLGVGAVNSESVDVRENIQTVTPDEQVICSGDENMDDNLVKCSSSAGVCSSSFTENNTEILPTLPKASKRKRPLNTEKKKNVNNKKPVKKTKPNFTWVSYP